MKCISKENIRKYIDGEVSSSEKLKIERHIKECDVCADKMKEETLVSNEIKSAINSIVDDNVSIPAFTLKREKQSKLVIQKKILLLTGILSAACFALLFGIFNYDNTHSQKSVPLVDFNYFDANKPITEQPLTIYVTNKNNIVYEYTIE